MTSTNGTSKPVTIGGHTITLRRLTYGGQIERSLMYRKFIAPREGDDPDNARWNFIALSTQTLDGAPIPLAHSSDSVDEFEGKFGALLDLDAELVEGWILAVHELSAPLVDRAQLPDEMLTDAEKKAETSNAAAPA